MQSFAPTSHGKSRATNQVCEPSDTARLIIESDCGAADLVSVGSDPDAITALTVQNALSRAWKDVDREAQTHVVKTIEEAVGVVRSLDGDVHVLITGSLHLVGGVLEVLEPAT